MSDQEKIARFYEKAEKYGGWKQVPASRIAEIFLEVVQPAKIGFEVVKPLLLAHHVDSEITQLIKLERLKGGVYTPQFGLSLAYVPYPYESQLKWHRTLKSVNFDLFELPHLYRGTKAQSLEGAEVYYSTSRDQVISEI